MNTHDKYELPPLPEARIVSYQTDSTMRSMELRTHSDEDMRDYARAAIEAYRKRQGEVVVTKTPEGEIVAVTRQDNEGKILSVIAEADRKRRGDDQQPFGYFRPEPFGWTDCAATDDGAIALYERPQAQGKPVACFKCGHAKHGGECVNVAPQPADTASRNPGLPSTEPRRIGKIVIDAKTQHPRAELSTGYDDQGNQWADGTAIYAQPASPQPAEPDEWKLAVDHELTNMQSTADSYPSAKEAVKALVDWHVAVATDPVFQQPAEPVKDETAYPYDMKALAARNLRSYLGKASFSVNVDRQAALNCVEVLEAKAEPVKVLSDAEIREVFLENGFTIKSGNDLKPYVYKAARALLARYGARS